jgi:hypothetical protein
MVGDMQRKRVTLRIAKIDALRIRRPYAKQATRANTIQKLHEYAAGLIGMLNNILGDDTIILVSDSRGIGELGDVGIKAGDISVSSTTEVFDQKSLAAPVVEDTMRPI